MLHHEMLKRQCSFPNIQHGCATISWIAQRASYFCNSFLMLWESCTFTFTLAKQFKLLPPPQGVKTMRSCRLVWDVLSVSQSHPILNMPLAPQTSPKYTYDHPSVGCGIGLKYCSQFSWTLPLNFKKMVAYLWYDTPNKKLQQTCKHALISLHLPNIDQTLIMVAGITTINQTSFLSSR